MSGWPPVRTPSAGRPLERVALGELAAALGLELRRAGLPVTPEREGRWVRVLELVPPLSLEELRRLGRITLASSPAELDILDRVFQAVFQGLSDSWPQRGQAGQPEVGSARARREDPTPLASSRGASGAARAVDEAGERELGLASAAERLAHKDFSECSPNELADLARLAAVLPISVPRRRGRRRRLAARGEAVDLRATLGRARRTGADPVRLLRRRRLPRPRRLVMIADVSGSMEPYTRVYLHLFHAAVRAARAEAFVFSTRLTRLTADLSAGDPDRALRLAGATAPDWAGGTRIGEALGEFNDRFGRRGMARGAVVVLVSDGWEGGGAERLGEEMARLARLAHRLVWVNPRSASSRFRPETAGMAAALPHVDQLVSGHSLAALWQLLEAIGEPPGPRDLGRILAAVPGPARVVR